MCVRQVWRPVAVAVVLWGATLLPSGVAAAAPTKPVSCVTVSRGWLGPSDDLLGDRQLACHGRAEEGRTADPVPQNSSPTGSRGSSAGVTGSGNASSADDDSSDGFKHFDDESRATSKPARSSSSDTVSEEASDNASDTASESQGQWSGTASMSSPPFGALPSDASAVGPEMLSGGLVQWRGDFNTGDTSQWDLETARDYSLMVVDGGVEHPTAGRFEVRDGDTPVDSGERSEADAPDWTDVSDGDERWYSFSMMFDRSFPNPTSFCDPIQWHTANSDGSAADGSPPLNLQCGSDGMLSLEVGEKTLLPVGPLDRNVWHHYLLHVKFSRDPGVAFEEMFRDGQVVIPRISPAEANMTTSKLYLKIGMYRDSDNDGSMVVWHDDLAVYTSATMASVGAAGTSVQDGSCCTDGGRR